MTLTGCQINPGSLYLEKTMTDHLIEALAEPNEDTVLNLEFQT
jgi:hypothetical protein